MLNSTKVKYFGITGTIVLIALSYTLSANAIYKDLHSKSEKIPTAKDIEKKSEESSLKEVENLPLTKSVEVKKVEKKVVSIEKDKKESSVDKKKIEPKATVKQSSFEKIEKILHDRGYITFDSDGEISTSSKETLELLSPLLSRVKDVYVEIEGYSVTLETQNKTQDRSVENAQKVYAFLSQKKIDKKLQLIGYGDMYPISDDKLDSRNSRVEIKIRRR